MRKLEIEGLIEGKRREIGKSKVWRLSKAGRNLLGVSKPSVPFNTPKMDHILGVGEIFQTLFESGRLSYFMYEPKDEFNIGRKMLYAPDAFFILNNPYKAYLLEYQRSPLSSARWAAKWAIASLFFEGPFMSASWQVLKGKILKPGVLAITEQGPQIANPGDFSFVTISKNIQAIL